MKTCSVRIQAYPEWKNSIIYIHYWRFLQILVIKGLALTKENYQIAINILKQRCINMEVVIPAHMDKMLISGLHDLRKVYDKININVKLLE